MSEIINRIKNIKNRILAMPTAATAIPVKPNIAATTAIRKKMMTRASIVKSFS